MMESIKRRGEVKKILQQLDACANEFTFPMLDNGYVYLIDSRMTIFSSKNYWGITIEVIGFDTRAGGHDGINNAVHVYGNFPGCDPGLKKFYYFTDNINDQKAFEEEHQLHLNPHARSIFINGNEYELVQQRERFLKVGIIIDDDCIGIQDYLRMIWPQIDEKPFLVPEELLQITHGGLNIKMQLEEWWHPDLAEDEFPSKTETFNTIAQAIANDDFTSLDKLLERSNTSWRNWPIGGTL